MSVAAKVHEDTYRIILYEAARRGVTVSVVVREALERTFNKHGGNRTVKDDVSVDGEATRR